MRLPGFRHRFDIVVFKVYSGYSHGDRRDATMQARANPSKRICADSDLDEKISIALQVYLNMRISSRD